MKKFLALALSALTLAFGAVFFAACAPDEPGPGDDPGNDPGNDPGGSTVEEAVADVYAPDGAPALALAPQMSEEMQVGGEGSNNVGAPSTIPTYVTGGAPQAVLWRGGAGARQGRRL